MNQGPRLIERRCFVCGEHKVRIRQIYDAHLSVYVGSEPPICEECRKKEERIVETEKMQGLRRSGLRRRNMPDGASGGI